jgi:zinc protease
MAQVAGEVAELDCYGLPLDELSRYLSAVERVTIEDLEEAARTHIRPQNMLLLVVGDAAEQERGIRELDLGPIVRVDAEGETLDAASAT